MQALINGKPCADDWMQDRGFAYGDGVFETIRVVDGELTLAQLHEDRLRAGLERLKISWPDALAEQCQAEVAGYAEQLGTGVLKVTVTRGYGGRGYAPPAEVQPTRIVAGFPLPDYPDWHAQEGVSVRTCKFRLGRQPALAGIKHLNRLEQVLARSEWQGTEVQEGILLDANDQVIEATAMNLFLVEGGTLVTPLLNDCGIEGVMRAVLMDTFRSRGVAVMQEAVGLRRMLEAEEIFLCNSVAGVWPVQCVDGQAFRIGELTRDAQQVAAGHLKLTVREPAL